MQRKKHSAEFKAQIDLELVFHMQKMFDALSRHPNDSRSPYSLRKSQNEVVLTALSKHLNDLKPLSDGKHHF